MGEKVSIKSTISCWVKFFATKRALYLSIEPFALYLILYTHLQPIKHFLGGKLVRDHVELTSKAWSSMHVASYHSGIIVASE